jgi:hypothetical protein
MAQRVVTELVDDLDGSALDEGAGETITFALDSLTFEIDLSDKNATKLRKAMAPYIAAGRRVGSVKRARTSSKRAANSDTKAIRAWAEDNGIELSARGRIPASVLEQYRAAS